MRTVQAGDKSVSILFSGEAAPRRRQALTLVRDALAERGLPLWRQTRVEMFSAGGDTLLIARPEAPVRMAFFFPDLETLLAGTEGCSGGNSSLYQRGRGYLLTLSAEDGHPGLYEFGQRTELSEDWEIHAREQGLCLVYKAAFAVLRRFLSTPPL